MTEELPTENEFMKYRAKCTKCSWESSLYRARTNAKDVGLIHQSDVGGKQWSESEERFIRADEHETKTIPVHGVEQ